MTVTVQKDLDNATLVVTTEYAAAPDRLWRLWADPRQLERWWGPPSHPGTVTAHDLTPGGAIAYYMTGPEGEKYHGGMRIVRVDPPALLEFEDYFADDSGAPNPNLPVSNTVVSIEGIDDTRTRMTLTTRYEDTAAMEKVLEMGVEEGIKQSIGQIDALLAETS